MSQQEDLYKILGVNESDSDEVIKKAYKKLAIKWHPDKNMNNKEEAEKKFKEISHAFSIIGDKQKRQEYDNMKKFGSGGFAGFGNGGFSSGGNSRFEEFFKDTHSFDFYDKMFKNFFKSDFGDFSAFDNDDGFFTSSFSTNNFGGSSGIGMGTSTKTVTTIINGKKVTKTEKSYTDSTGKRITEVTETTGDGKSKTTKMIGDNSSSNPNKYKGGNSVNIAYNNKNNFDCHGFNNMDDDFDDFNSFGGFGNINSMFNNNFDDYDPFRRNTAKNYKKSSKK